MKKISTALALATLAGAAHAAPFFDSLYTSATETATKSLTFTSSTPRRNMGGIFGLDSGSFKLDSITFAFANFGATTVVNQTIGVKIYSTLTSSTVATDPLFLGNPIVNTTGTFNNVNLATNTYVPATISGLGGVVLDDAHEYGIILSSGDNNVSFGISYGSANYVGNDLGFDGYFRDANDNGMIENNEGRTLGLTNQALAFQLDGQPVPEPASMLALGLGAAAMLRRRKKA